MTANSTDSIRSLADVRPGDICITTMGGFIPGFLPVRLGQMICKESFMIGPYSADHVLICVEAGERKPVAELPNGTLFGYDGRSAMTYPRAVQAMPRGAEEIALTPAKHWTDGAAWFRLDEDYPGQAADAAAIARLFVSEKVPYSFLSYLALAAWSRGLKVERLERWIDRRSHPFKWVNKATAMGRLEAGAANYDDTRLSLPREAICSVLVDQAWSLAGKRVMEGVKRQCVTPGAMAIQLARRYTAYGPGFLASTP